MRPLTRTTSYTKAIDGIESRIHRLNRRASDLLEREHGATQEVIVRERALGEAGGRVRRARRRRALRRSQERLERLAARRRELIDDQIRSIMFALQHESQRTRDELDRELERLAPVQERWERLRSTFDALEGTIRGPAFVALAEHWQGQLEIPEFPVAQHSEYTKPFPRHALLF